MIKSVIKKIIKFFSFFIAFFGLLLSALLFWVWLAPRDVPFAKDVILRKFEKLAPSTTSVQIDSIKLSLDSYRLNLQVRNIKILDEVRGEFNLDQANFFLDPRGLFPQSHRNIINIQITQPNLKLGRLLNQDSDSNSPLPLQEVNDYINKHKKTLLKLSLSFENTEFSYDRADGKKAKVLVNSLTIKPHLISDKMLVNIEGDVSIGNKSNKFEASLDTSSNKFLSVMGSISNVSTATLAEFGFEIPELKGSHIEVDISLNGMVRGTRTFEYLDFEVDNLEGIIRANDFFNRDIVPQKLHMKGFCTNNCQEVTVEKLSLQANEINLNAAFEIKKRNGANYLDLNFALGKIPVSSVGQYWPKTIIPRTKDWIFEHIYDGNIKQATGGLALNLDEITLKKRMDGSTLNIKIDVEDTKVHYLDSAPAVTNVDGAILITQDLITFDVASANISKSKIMNAKGSIPDLGTSKSRVIVSGEFNGEAQDLVDIAFLHAELENSDLKNLNGKIDGTVSVNIPIIDEDLTLKDINLLVKAKTNNLSAKNIFNDYSISDSNFDIEVSNNTAKVKGNTLVNNNLLTEVEVSHDLIKDLREVTVKAEIDWEKLDLIGVESPNFIFNKAKITAKEIKFNGKTSQSISADLSSSTILVKTLGITKKLGEIGSFSADVIETKDNFILKNLVVKTPNFETVAEASFKKNKYELLTMSSKDTRYGKSNFSFKIKKENNGYSINVLGDSFDISKISFGSIDPNKENEEVINSSQEASKKKSESKSYKLDVNVNKLFFKNDIVVSNPELSIMYTKNKIESAKVAGKFANAKSFTFDINYPNVSAKTDDLGTLAKAFDVTDKIVDGELSLNGSFSENNFKGELLAYDFRVKKMPLFSKLISVVSLTTTSFEGLTNIFTNSGVKFKKLSCPLTYEELKLNLEDCYMSGPTMAITGTGEIDFNSDVIKVKGQLIPENIINKILKNIPVIGSAFNGDRNTEALGVSYSVSGSIDDPEVSSNPLSILAPGLMKNLFN